jgi:hypothetical protein
MVRLTVQTLLSGSAECRRPAAAAGAEPRYTPQWPGPTAKVMVREHTKTRSRETTRSVELKTRGTPGFFSLIERKGPQCPKAYLLDFARHIAGICPLPGSHRLGEGGNILLLQGGGGRDVMQCSLAGTLSTRLWTVSAD